MIQTNVASIGIVQLHKNIRSFTTRNDETKFDLSNESPSSINISTKGLRSKP